MIRGMISILMIAVSIMTAVASNASPERKFAVFADQKDYYDYTCITPDKEKAAPTNLPVEKIKLIEMVTTGKKGNSAEMLNAITKTVADDDMLLLSVQNTEKNLNEFYAHWDDKRDLFTHLLILKYKDPEHRDTKLMYIVGDLTSEDINKLF